MQVPLNKQKKCEFCHLQVSHDFISVYATKVTPPPFFLLFLFFVVAAWKLSCSGLGHVGSICTNEEQTNLGS